MTQIVFLNDRPTSLVIGIMKPTAVICIDPTWTWEIWISFDLIAALFVC